jgi:hypothetical protein
MVAIFIADINALCMCSIMDLINFITFIGNKLMVFLGGDYWVFGLCPLSSILKNTIFEKLHLFSSSGEAMGDTYFVGSLKKS